MPLRAAVGKLFRFSQLPMNMHLGAYYSAVTPKSLRRLACAFQMQFMFPK